MTKRDRPFSWLSPAPLWHSRNDRLVRWFRDDPTNRRREAWMKELGRDDPGLLVDYADSAPISFLVMGDTGEGDASQYALVRPLESEQDGTSFLFICSDVIYPAGGIAEYGEKFYRPYLRYQAPIYAVPGNHDWYDDASGFMYWFCGARMRPSWPRQRMLSKLWWRDLLWRDPAEASEDELATVEDLRRQSHQRGHQPAPYLCIDAGPVRVIGIDTGIRGDIDAEQGDWLRRVSAGPRPKILLTGKPIYVDGQHHPGRIEGGGTVDQIVTSPENNYIAAIGGDIHNYQRYPITLEDGRTLLYLVSGGGGAFMHETHSIPKLDWLGVKCMTEDRLKLYPMRGDSLSRYSQLYGRKFRFAGGRFLYIEPDEAAAIVGKRLGVTPTRAAARAIKPRRRARIAARILFALPGRGRRGLHIPFSEWLDWNEPPFFKSFLRFDVNADDLTIRCFAATGCARQQHSPPVEDRARARRGVDGTWTWECDTT